MADVTAEKMKIISVLAAMSQEKDEIKKKIVENSEAYFRKYSAASADCETGAGGESSNMTFGESYELCRGFVVQPRINDTTGPVSN